MQFGSSCGSLRPPCALCAHASSAEQQFWATHSAQACVAPSWVASATTSEQLSVPTEDEPPTPGPLVAPPLPAEGLLPAPPLTTGDDVEPPPMAGPDAAPPFTAGDEGVPLDVELELELYVC